MIGIWNTYSDMFLIIAGVAMLVAFGLPLMLVPMSWARVYRWPLPQDRTLAVFLGRSIGVIISIMAIFAFRVTQIPAAKPFFFDLMLATFVGMIVLHVYGALRKAQPLTETVEIAMWVGLSLVTLGFYPA